MESAKGSKGPPTLALLSRYPSWLPEESEGNERGLKRPRKEEKKEWKRKYSWGKERERGKKARKGLYGKMERDPPDPFASIHGEEGGGV